MFAINCKTKPLTPYQPTRDGSVREEEMLKMVVLFYICYSCINVILGCFPFCVLYFLPFSSLYPSAFSLYFPLNVSLRRFKNHHTKAFWKTEKIFLIRQLIWWDSKISDCIIGNCFTWSKFNSVSFMLCVLMLYYSSRLDTDISNRCCCCRPPPK